MTRRVSQKVAVSAVYVAAMFITVMDSTIVNVALPTIGRTFGVPATSVASVSIYFLVSLAVFISASGWLGDRFGGKRVLLVAIAVFTAASALCGLAGSLTELDIFRVLQGVGGGMMTPVGLAMLFRAFPSDERVRASAILIVPTTLAPALGPIIGGLLVTDLSWRWVFYVNVPLGILALGFRCAVPRRWRDAAAGPVRHRRLPAFRGRPRAADVRPVGGTDPALDLGRRAVLDLFRRSSTGRACGHRTAYAAAPDRPAAAVQPVVPVSALRPACGGCEC